MTVHTIKGLRESFIGDLRGVLDEFTVGAA